MKVCGDLGGWDCDLSRVYMYVRGNSHDQQAAWLNCGKIDVDVVVGKGESSKRVVMNGLKNVPERVLS